ncbi:MAG: hypothetical protein KC645_06695 [Gemmatimonadetes bacterium]|nr:hypothetical protein [Gemmatimonadota bacterium]
MLLFAFAGAGCDTPLPAPLTRADSLTLEALIASDTAAVGSELILEAHAWAGTDPVAGTPVVFRILEGGGRLTGSVVHTEADGRARTRWELGTVPGPARVEASVPVARAERAVILVAGPAVHLARDSAAALPTAAVGTSLDDPVRVRVLDAFGNGAPGVRLVGGAVDVGPTDTVWSDGNGVAAFTWTLGPRAGVQRYRVVLPGRDSVEAHALGLPGSAHAVAVEAGDGQSGEVGVPLPTPLVVQVRDRFGNAVPGVPVSFQDSALAAPILEATTDSVGRAGVVWTPGHRAGPQTVWGFATGTDTARIALTGRPGAPVGLGVVAGQGQVGAAGGVLPVEPRVRAVDAWSNAVPGVRVDFTVAEGGGSLSRESAITDASGDAGAGAWTLGPPGVQRLRATLVGVPAAVEITATAEAPGGPGFALEVWTLGVWSVADAALLDQARAAWQAALTQDLSDVSFAGAAALPAGACGVSHPVVSHRVDDLLVLVDIGALDGPGGAAARSGVCRIRSGTLLPVVSTVRIDASDLAAVRAAGLLGDLLRHEIGHALGLGVFWPAANLLTGAGGPDPLYRGTQGTAAWALLGGSGSPPVENTGGAGVRDVHWRESVLVRELMTPVLTPGPNPLSLLSLGALQDLGYGVDASAAEPYAPAPGLPAVPGAPGFRDEVWLGAPVSVDASGRPQGGVPGG